MEQPKKITAKHPKVGDLLLSMDKELGQIVEASEGLRSAFSIEASADEYTIDKGVMKVSKATLTGVAHVTNPAFKAAQITEVAATETTEAEEAAEEQTEETTVDDEKETAVAEEVTASAVAPIVASAPVAYTQPRNPIKTKANYLEHSIKASLEIGRAHV